LGSSLTFHVLDGYKNLHYLADGLREAGAFDGPLAAYRMDEVTWAFLPVNVAEGMAQLANPKSAQAFFEATPDARLLVLERNLGKLPEGITARLKLIRRWTYSKHRSYGLYEFVPGPSGGDDDDST
jgi:hypothetical protein